MKIGYAIALAAGIGLALSYSAASPVAAQQIAPHKQTLSIPFTAAGSRTIQCTVTFGPAVPVAAVAFSPDGKKLAVGGYGEVAIWDLENGAFARRIGAGTLRTVGAVVFLDDSRLAVGDGTPYGDGAVRIFDVASGRPVHSFQEPKEVVYALAVSPDGKLLAAGGGDHLARVWSLDQKKLVATLKEHNALVSGVAFSRDGKLLATASEDKTVQVWEVATWSRKIKFREKEPVQGAIFASDVRMVFLAVGGGTERSIRYRRTDNVRSTRSYSTGAGIPLDIAWIAKTNRMAVPCSDGIVRILDVNGRTQASLGGHGDWVYAAAISADGSRLASGSGDGTVKLWSLADNKLLATFVQLAPGADQWLVVTAQGYLAASATDAIQWKAETLNTTPDKILELLQKPEFIKQTLAGGKVDPPAIP